MTTRLSGIFTNSQLHKNRSAHEQKTTTLKNTVGYKNAGKNFRDNHPDSGHSYLSGYWRIAFPIP